MLYSAGLSANNLKGVFMSNLKRLKKISVKELLGLSRKDDGAEAIKKLIAEGHESIFRIKGDVTGYTTKATSLGESFALTGNFLAQSLISGEMFESSKAYLPKSFSEDIVANFANRQENAIGVGFTAEVLVLKDSSSATGYTYDVKNLETKENLAWKQQAMQEFMALPAPSKVKAIGNKKTA